MNNIVSVCLRRGTKETQSWIQFSDDQRTCDVQHLLDNILGKDLACSIILCVAESTCSVSIDRLCDILSHPCAVAELSEWNDVPMQLINMRLALVAIYGATRQYENHASAYTIECKDFTSAELADMARKSAFIPPIRPHMGQLEDLLNRVII